MAFWHTNGSPYLGQMTRQPDLIIINKKKRTCRIVDFAVPTDLRIKLKESVKKDKYLDLVGELQKLLNMKVTFIPIVIGALVTVTKRIGTGNRGFGNKRTRGDHPNY